MSFLFKGISSENYFVVEKVYRSLLPPVENASLKIAGKPGAYHQKTKLGIRKHDFVIRIREENIDNLNDAIRTIAGWLFSDQPAELVLNKEPDKYYLAILDGETDLEEIVRIGKGTLSFISEDPLAYDRIESLQSIASGTDSASVDVGGTYETFPLVKATFNAATTFFSYASDQEGEQVVMGTPLNAADQEAIVTNELIMQETGISLDGWASSGVVIEDASISGTMQATGDKINAANIGTGTVWHGPAIKKNLPMALDNYMVDAWFRFNLTDYRMMAKIELYLYDINGNVIGRMRLYDAFLQSNDTMGNIRIGDLASGQHLINTHGSYAGVWNQFYGLLRLEKIGRVFKAYIGKVQLPGYIHHTRANEQYFDANDDYQADLAAIGLFIGGYGTRAMPSNADIYLDSLNVYRKNIANENQLENIAEAGDVIEIDHYTKSVLKNGIPFKQRLNPYSNLFPLKPGSNAIGFQPSDLADIEISYRNRWL